jgi:DNA-binding MarR family transcriptional regulator
VKLEDALKTGRFSSELQKAALNVMYTSWWLKTAISKQLKELGLSSEQYNVLRILKGKHPERMCIKDIGSRMIERNSNVPRIIDRLVSKSLVDRANSHLDKRETVISLTSAGIDILLDATRKIDSLFANSLVLDDASSKQLNQLLESFRAGE